MGHKEPRQKVQYKNQGRESGRDRNTALMEDKRRNRDDNNPCLGEKPLADHMSHRVPVKKDLSVVA